MKYRMLLEEELSILEEDFKQFLIVNGVHNEEWEEMNRTDEAKAIQLVELFSDTVLQKVYEKVRFIEHRTHSSCMVFKLDDDQIQLISINTKHDSTADLSTPESIHEAMVKSPNELTFFKTAKKYSKERETEIHEMFMHGCVHSSEAFWINLEKVVN